jgi:hypothetical protein
LLAANRNAQVQNQNIRPGTDIPRSEGFKQRDVARSRFELSTVEKQAAYKEAQIRKIQRQLILSEIFDTDILMQPITRVIRAIDTIGITPEYITTILMPSNITIMEAQASFDAALLERKQNLLRLRPKRKGFASGNIVLTLSDGNKNYEMTIIVNRYYQQDCQINDGGYICKKMRQVWTQDKNSKSYAYAFNNLSLYYHYISPSILDPLDAIAEYEKLKKKRLNIKSDGDFDMFVFRGISYKIIRDDTHGDIYYRAHKYRVIIGA